MSSSSLDLPSPRRPRRLLAGILAGIAISVVAVGLGLWVFTGFGLFEFARMMRGGQVRINVDQPTVIRQIRALQRIETVSYTMDKIISGERENPVLPHFLAGDRMLLVVHGEVIAGVDLSKLQPSDVRVSGTTVTLHLPAPDLFVTRIDNAKTRVYSRDTGMFSTPDPNLESQVREEAENQLRAAALQDGILVTANKNARQTLTSLLNGLGFTSVEFR